MVLVTAISRDVHAPLLQRKTGQVAYAEDIVLNLSCAPDEFVERTELQAKQEVRSGFRLAILTNNPVCVEPLLHALKKSGHEVVTVCSVKPAVAELCQQHGISFIEFPECRDGLNFGAVCKQDPEYDYKVEQAFRDVRKYAPEVMFTCGFYVLPKYAISIPSKAAINFHPADLPLYPGALPLHAMILRGEKQFRSCIHKLTERIDDSMGILSVSEVIPICPYTDDTTSLYQKGMCVLPDLLMHALQSLAEDRAGGFATVSSTGGPLPELPETSLPHAFGIRTVEHMDPSTGQVMKSNAGVMSRVRVEWDEDSALDVYRAVRAFGGNFGTYSDYEGVLWKIEACSLVPECQCAEPSKASGRVLSIEDLDGGSSRVCVTTFDGRAVNITGRFARETAEHNIEVGGCFRSCTPHSQVLGMSRVDRVVGAPRYT